MSWSLHVRGTTAIAIAISIATASISAHASQPTADALPEYVELDVAETVIETELVRTWASEAVGGGLGDAKVERAAVGRTLAVTIAGTPFNYDLTIGVKERGEWIGDLRSGKCKCDDTQLVSRVRDDVAAVAPRLQPAVAPPTIPPTTNGPTTEAPQRVPLAGKGKAGVAMLVVGATGVIAGGVLLGLGLSEGVANDDPSATDSVDRRPAGAGVLAVGGALVVVGAVLLGLDRRDAKRKRAVSVAPAGGHTSFGLVISGRF